MTAHDHTTLVPGCFRCELGQDEAADAVVNASKAKRQQRKRQRDRLRAEVAKRDKAITAIRAERNRLRSALERIAAGDVPGVTFADDDLIAAFASGALTRRQASE